MCKPATITIDDFCDNVLPSGSGFDCKWEWIKQQKNGSEVFETYYHNMNSNGYYDGFTKIRLTIPAVLIEFRITLDGKAGYRDYMNREYYNDTIWQSLQCRAFTLSKD